MLVLSRKAEEAIIIGEDVTVKVLSVSGGRVRLAIDAPRDVRIMRQELVDFEQDRERPANSLPVQMAVRRSSAATV